MSELIKNKDEEIQAIAEAKKKAGNDAFSAKNYDEAIRLYSEAIGLDKTNHVYFSNRSACYGFKGEWEKAAADARQCIELNADFIKGYYRLSTAQLQLLEFSEAETTVRNGLKKEPGNTDLQKQLRVIKAKKASALNRARRAAGSSRESRKADEAHAKEIMEVADAVDQTTVELQETASKLQTCRREAKRVTLTTNQVQGISGETTPLYRAVGKMFVLSNKTDVMEHLEKQAKENEKSEESLKGRQAYLERRLKSQQANLQDLQHSSRA